MTISRRGFLGAMLAAAAAPAFVKADSLMPIFVPKAKIILPPTLEIACPNGLEPGEYNFSVWAKTGGEWERICKKFIVGGQARTLKIEMPGNDPLLYGMELTAERPLFKMPELQLAIRNGSLRFDAEESPYMPGQLTGTHRYSREQLA